MALHGGGHHGGGHHGGRGPRFFGGGGGGGYFAPPSYYTYPDYYEPNYVPVFIVEDDDDKKRKEAERIALEAARLALAKKKGTSGLGIFTPPPRTPLALQRRRPFIPRRPMQGLGVTFGNQTYDATVYAAQVFLNTVLKSRGYLAIDTDGKLGKATCGAVAWLMQGGASDINKGIDFDLNTVPTEVFSVWNVCASSAQTPPTAVSAAAKTSSYETAVAANAAAPLNPQAVMDAQTALNVALAAAGMCAIGVDGSAGPDTCGAQTWLIANAGGDGLTQTQRDAISRKCSTSSKNTPAACGQPVAPTHDLTPPTPPPAPFVKPPVKTASIVMGVGIAGAVAAGLYMYFKHKSGG